MKPCQGGYKMRPARFASIMILMVTASIMAEGCATKKAITHDYASNRLIGKWVNTDNPDSGTYVDLTQDASDTAEFFHPQKLILTSKKIWQVHHSTDDPLAAGYGTYTIRKCWVDVKENTFCQALLQFVSGSRFYTLFKLDSSNAVLECNWYYGGEERYPEKIIEHDVIIDDFRSSDVSLYYNIYHRLE